MQELASFGAVFATCDLVDWKKVHMTPSWNATRPHARGPQLDRMISCQTICPKNHQPNSPKRKGTLVSLWPNGNRPRLILRRCIRWFCSTTITHPWNSS